MVAAVIILAGLTLHAQKPADMVGTWVGDATLEGLDDPNTLTLVLELKEGKLEGSMVDQYGTINDEISDVVLEGDAFNFESPVAGPSGVQATILYKMKITGDSMKGTIEIPEMGMKGAWQATKQK
jgi:hypothetical protein